MLDYTLGCCVGSSESKTCVSPSIASVTDRQRQHGPASVYYFVASREPEGSNVLKDKGVGPKRMGCARRNNLGKGCPFIFFQ